MMTGETKGGINVQAEASSVNSRRRGRGKQLHMLQPEAGTTLKLQQSGFLPHPSLAIPSTQPPVMIATCMQHMRHGKQCSLFQVAAACLLEHAAEVVALDCELFNGCLHSLFRLRGKDVHENGH